ncbi:MULTISPECIES: ABC transporter permease [unclassified Nocardioides]|uniref:ABC transporter permease n=1 Tax=unclassified Nocardioides TaxID=2615069 RepID=UPI0000570D7C|nr:MULTISPECIES: ABC transporter permease [unclassified Nocardioides]ABL79519.1 ABC-2 type transporter [Nocardioides sp. JS614]
MTTLTLDTTIPTPTGRPLQVRLLGNEIAKGLRLAWHRKGMIVVGTGLGLLNYLGINLFIGGGHIVTGLMTLTLPALLALTVAQAAAINGSGGIAEEINGGTLEQTRLSPASAYLQATGRMAALAVEGLLAAAVLAAILTAWFGLDYSGHASAVVPAALTMLNALAYGLLMTALTLRVASIGAITHVFNMAIMVFGGMLVPVTVFPGPIETVSHLVPTALGVQAFNTTLADGLGQSWTDGTLPWLLVHTTVLLLAGLATYGAALRRALREGALSPR